VLCQSPLQPVSCPKAWDLKAHSAGHITQRNPSARSRRSPSACPGSLQAKTPNYGMVHSSKCQTKQDWNWLFICAYILVLMDWDEGYSMSLPGRCDKGLCKETTLCLIHFHALSCVAGKTDHSCNLALLCLCRGVYFQVCRLPSSETLVSWKIRLYCHL